MSQQPLETNSSQPETMDYFAGLDVYSTAEELAVAELQTQLAVAEPGSSDRKLLRFQLDKIMVDLGTYYPGYEMPAEEGIKMRLAAEQTELVKEGVAGYDVSPAMAIGHRANEARWRLSGIDPATVDPTDRYHMEMFWSDAAEKQRQAKLAAVQEQVAKLYAEQQLASILGEEPAVDVTEEAIALSASVKILRRNESQSRN